MRHILIYLIIICAFFVSPAKGQENNTTQTLEGLYKRLIDVNNDSIRIRINDSIKIIIDGYVESDTAFTHRFANIRNLGQIASPDNKIKIITWNLVLRNSPGRYFCYIIYRQGKKSKNLIYRITTLYNESTPLTDTLYSGSDWYGALYYDIKPVKTGKKVSWMLLGLDYGNPLISRKVIDVMSFTYDGSIVFGKKWFVSKESIKFREVFEYSSEGRMTLRFTSARAIVFDHLAPFQPGLEGDHRYYGPDTSYDAYILKNGVWTLSSNFDARNIKD